MLAHSHKTATYVMIIVISSSQVCWSDWTVTFPADGSNYFTTSDVPASGAAGGAGTKQFKFGRFVNNEFVSENACNVTATQEMGIWSWQTAQGDLDPPSGGWQVSPLIGGGPMREGDHYARIVYGAGETEWNQTHHHSVYP